MTILIRGSISPHMDFEILGGIELLISYKKWQDAPYKSPREVRNQMKSKKEDIVKKSIVVSEIYKGKTFKSFDTLRKRVNRLIAEERENWLNAVLIKNSIFINKETMTRREIVQIFEKNLVRILDEDKVYTVYKGDTLIGEWKYRRGIHMSEDGKMEIRIQYVII